MLQIPNTDAPGIKVTVSLPALIKSLEKVCVNSWLCSPGGHLRIELLLGGIWPHTEDAILTLPPYLNTRLKEFRDECRHADTQVGVITILELFSCPSGYTLADGKRSSLLRCKLGFFRSRVCQSKDFDMFGNGSLDHSVYVDAGDMNGVWRKLASWNDLFGL